MENLMEQNMENSMDTGTTLGSIGVRALNN